MLRDQGASEVLLGRQFVGSLRELLAITVVSVQQSDQLEYLL